jgi:hypothetical protein
LGLAISPAASISGGAKGTELTSAVDATVPAQHRKAVERAQIFGQLLQDEDQAAWVASDVAESTKAFDGHPKASGWIARATELSGKTWVVSFTESSEAGSASFLDVEVRLSGGRPKVIRQPNAPSRPLEGFDRAAVLARDAILARNDWLRCAEKYNHSTSVQEDSKGRVVVVKLLPARTELSTFPMGGFHEFRVPAYDGPVEHFAQTQGCMTLQSPPAGAEGLMVSHVTSATPTQFHVFMSLSYAIPIYVVTQQNELTWKVAAGRISVVDPISKGEDDADSQ